MGTLEKSAYYKFKTFKSTQTVNIPFIGEVIVDELCNTTNPSRVTLSYIEADKQLIDSIRQDAARKISAAQQDAARQKARSQRRKEKLKAAGISDSSSSSNSPEKDKRN